MSTTMFPADYYAEREAPQSVLGEECSTFEAVNELHTSRSCFDPYRFHPQGGGSWLGWFEQAFSGDGPAGLYTTPDSTKAFLVSGKQGYLVDVFQRSAKCLPSPVTQVCSICEQGVLVAVSLAKFFIISKDGLISTTPSFVTDDLKIVTVQTESIIFDGFVARFGERRSGELRFVSSERGVEFVRWLG